MYDRKLLGKLSLCAWKVLSEYLKQGVTVYNPIPGCVTAIQTFGEFLNFNPHLHVIATDGCFYGDGEFMTCLVSKSFKEFCNANLSASFNQDNCCFKFVISAEQALKAVKKWKSVTPMMETATVRYWKTAGAARIQRIACKV